MKISLKNKLALLLATMGSLFSVAGAFDYGVEPFYTLRESVDYKYLVTLDGNRGDQFVEGTEYRSWNYYKLDGQLDELPFVKQIKNMVFDKRTNRLSFDDYVGDNTHMENYYRFRVYEMVDGAGFYAKVDSSYLVPKGSSEKKRAFWGDYWDGIVKETWGIGKLSYDKTTYDPSKVYPLVDRSYPYDDRRYVNAVSAKDGDPNFTLVEDVTKLGTVGENVKIVPQLDKDGRFYRHHTLDFNEIMHEARQKGAYKMRITAHGSTYCFFDEKGRQSIDFHYWAHGINNYIDVEFPIAEGIATIGMNESNAKESAYRQEHSYEVGAYERDATYEGLYHDGQGMGTNKAVVYFRVTGVMGSTLYIEKSVSGRAWETVTDPLVGDKNFILADKSQMLDTVDFAYEIDAQDYDRNSDVKFRMVIRLDNGEKRYTNEVSAKIKYLANFYAMDKDGYKTENGSFIHVSGGTFFNIDYYGSVAYGQDTKRFAHAILKSDKDTVVALPKNGYKFSCWMDELKNCVSYGDSLVFKVSGDTNFYALFNEVGAGTESISMYPYSYTHGKDAAKYYSSDNAPVNFDYYYGDDSLSVRVSASNTLNRNEYAVLQVSVDGGEWTRVTSRSLLSSNGYHIDDVELGVPRKNLNGGSRMKIRAALCASMNCGTTGDPIATSATVYLAVKRKIVLVCESYDHCYDKGIHFADFYGVSYGDNDTLWASYNEIVNLKAFESVEYEFNGWEDYHYNTVSEEKNYSFMAGDETAAEKFSYKGVLYVNANIGYRYLKANVVSNDVPAVGLQYLAFRQVDGALELKSGNELQIRLADGTYADYTINPEAGLEPGSYRATLTFEFANENDKALALLSDMYEGDAYRSNIKVNDKNASQDYRNPYDGGSTIRYNYYFILTGYSVSFMDGSDVYKTKYAAANGTVTAPYSDPVKFGYTFAGWYVSEADDAEEYDFSTPITADVKVYAKWVRTGFGAITITADRSMATISGTSDETVSIESDVVVDNVEFARTFNAGVLNSIVLPFDVPNGSTANAQFYSFSSVSVNAGTNAWEIHVKTIAADQLKANTPYLLKPDDAALAFDFNGKQVTLKTGEASVTLDDWRIVGTYSYKAWPAEELGKLYGLAGQAVTGINAGQFVRLAYGADIYPMRAYLVHETTPAPSGKPRLNGSAAMQVAGIDAPETIDIVIDEADGGVTVIGSLNTRTGELKPATRWLDLKGRRINKKASAKGSYYSNLKRTVVK